LLRVEFDVIGAARSCKNDELVRHSGNRRSGFEIDRYVVAGPFERTVFWSLCPVDRYYADMILALFLVVVNYEK